MIWSPKIFFGRKWQLGDRIFPALSSLALIPGPHRHRIYDRREEALPDGRRSGGDEGMESRLIALKQSIS